MQQHIYLISGLKKMKSISFLLVLLFTATSSFAQTYETNPFYQATTNWVFGDSVWLHFSDTGIVENSLPIDILGEASSSFSDSDGNLLFYIQPESLFNSTGNKITQLEGGNSSRQGSLILPLKEDSLFYIIIIALEARIIPITPSFDIRYHRRHIAAHITLGSTVCRV
jgi:hypothetical protein